MTFVRLLICAVMLNTLAGKYLLGFVVLRFLMCRKPS